MIKKIVKIIRNIKNYKIVRLLKDSKIIKKR